MKKFSIQKIDSSQKTYFLKAMPTSHLRKKIKFSKDLLFYIITIFKFQGKHVSVEKKRIFVQRERERESSIQKTSISWWNASHSFWSVRRNLWRSLSESIGVFMTSLVQTTKTKSLLKMRGLRSIKKWALKRVRSFLISYVEWNLNEELARYFTNALVSSDHRVSLQVKTCVLL